MTEFRTSSESLVFYYNLAILELIIDFYPFADSDGKKVSREMSLHPVHLTPDKEGNLPPSALVPFCSYQGNSSLIGQERPELGDLTVCDKFEPTILEGQLCYSLGISKLGEKTTKSGQANGLLLLLDPNPYRLNKKNPVGFGTKSFEQLPTNQRNCLVHNREECQTRKYLDQVQNECKCSPWPLETDPGTNQVKS